MPSPITQVQPPLEFIPPDFDPLVYRGMCAVLPFWMKLRVAIADVEVENAKQLVELFQQFQAGKTRFLLAFRHPTPDDPFSLLWLLSRSVPQAARELGVSLQRPVHAHFIYDRGIPLWAGKFVGWLLPKMGCVPVKRGKADLVSLKAVRDLFANGRFPMAASPEGGTNGHNEIVSPLEPGIAQFGFWCVEDLQKAQRTESVALLPVGIQYHYITPPWRSLEQLLLDLEADTGIRASVAPAVYLGLQDGTDPTPEQQTQLYQRLLGLGETLLTQMEGYYSKYYGRSLVMPDLPADADPNTRLAARLKSLLDTALKVAEEFFAIAPKGSLTDRCRRLEQAGWERIFREDLNLETLSPAERGLADRIAEEADLRIWHMRLVENFVSVTGRYVMEKPTAERFAETLLLLRNMVNRLKGEAPKPPLRLGPRRVVMTVGTPISVSDRAEQYRANRREAVSQLTQDLQAAMEGLIR